MVLQGLQHSLFLGWIFGILPLKSPNGTPEQASRKHPLSILFLLLLSLNLLLRLDVYLAHNSNLIRESMVVKFLDLSLLLGETFFDLFFRINLIFRSKLLVKFLKTLESDMKKFAPNLILSKSDQREWKISARFVWITLIFHFISGALAANWIWNVFTYSFSTGSFFGKYLPGWLYSVLFYIFGELPVICSISVAFSLVIVTTFHLLWIFYDFCECLEEQIAVYDDKVKEKTTFGFAKLQLGELDNFSVFSVASTAMKMQNSDQVKKHFKAEAMGMNVLMGKLDHLKLICNQFDKVCGGLLLGLIVRAVYVLVSSANAILLYENPNGEAGKSAKNILDLFLFPTEVLQLWLLPLGAVFRRKINERKEKLSRMVIFMTNLEARTDLRNVISAFTEWDWTLTGGPGFFDVDRSLLSGVVSSLMTYVTIIFQLNTEEMEKHSPGLGPNNHFNYTGQPPFSNITN